MDGVDLVAGPGEVVTLLGPNGAGKTSTVEAAEGYRRPSGGSVRVLGHDPVTERSAVAPVIGVMLQKGGVYPGMGPREALRLFAHYYPDPRGPEELLERVGLGRAARTPWRRLSGGEQQRLSLALALVGRPRVVFLDEPTSGVDPEGRQVLRDIVASLREEGACTVLTTHELEEAERLATRVVVMAKGRVVASGALEELAAQAGPGEVQWTSRPGVDVSSLSLLLGSPVAEPSPGRYRVAMAGGPGPVATLTGWLAAQGLPIEQLRAGRPSLEELYLRLTAQARADEAPGDGPGDGQQGLPRRPRRGRAAG